MTPDTASQSETVPVQPPPDPIAQLFSELEAKFRDARPRDDFAPVENAFRPASEYHKGQLRDSGEQYILHPLMVAHILADMRMDLVSVVTGLLHDVVEDTSVQIDEIRRN